MISIMPLNFYLNFTCVLLNGKRLDDLIILINTDLEMLFTWLQTNKLTLNGQKTYYIIFHRVSINVANHSSTLVMGDSIFAVTNEIKYLGVIIDNMDTTRTSNPIVYKDCI